MSVTDARKYCEGQGGQLASIHSPLEQQQAWDACKAVVKDPSGPASCWIGLNDNTREGRWTWLDGSATDFHNWSPGQPDNHVLDGSDNLEGSDQTIDDEDVVELRSGDGWWNDNVEGGNNYGKAITGWYPLCQSTAVQSVHKGTAFEYKTDAAPIYEINCPGPLGAVKRP